MSNHKIELLSNEIQSQIKTIEKKDNMINEINRENLKFNV